MDSSENPPACGQTISTAPMKPMISPSLARVLRLWPRGPSVPKPAIQNAEVALINADWLDGTH